MVRGRGSIQKKGGRTAAAPATLLCLWDEAALRQVNRQLDRQGVGDRWDKGTGERRENKKREKWDKDPEIFVRKISSWSWEQAAWKHPVWCNGRKSKFIYLYCIFILIGTSSLHLAVLVYLRKHWAQGNLNKVTNHQAICLFGNINRLNSNKQRSQKDTHPS